MSCCIDYDGFPVLFSERVVKARKDHTCCECGEVIKKGSEYEYVTGLWEGGFNTFKTCEKCADLRESLELVTCTSYGNLKSDHGDYLSSEL